MIMSTEEMAAVLGRNKMWYLASVYTSYPEGLDAAAIAAETLGAKLMAEVKVPFFCPIAHWHRMSIISGVDKTDFDFWMEMDRPFMERCDGIIVPLMKNWTESRGIQHELRVFEAARKPIVYWRHDLPV